MGVRIRLWVFMGVRAVGEVWWWAVVVVGGQSRSVMGDRVHSWAFVFVCRQSCRWQGVMVGHC